MRNRTTSRTGIDCTDPTRPRRSGSFRVVNRDATTRPGIATSMKVSCHGCSSPIPGREIGGNVATKWMRAPPTSSASALPVTNPKFRTEMARGSFSCGNRSANIE